MNDCATNLRREVFKDKKKVKYIGVTRVIFMVNLFTVILKRSTDFSVNLEKLHKRDFCFLTFHHPFQVSSAFPLLF